MGFKLIERVTVVNIFRIFITFQNKTKKDPNPCLHDMDPLLNPLFISLGNNHRSHMEIKLIERVTVVNIFRIFIIFQNITKKDLDSYLDDIDPLLNSSV